MIAIRVDANEIIASGHLMRCLSIADALFSFGEEIAFYTSDDYASQVIRNRGFKAICLNNNWNNKDGELPDLIKELNTSRPDMLLVDSYQVTYEYLKSLRSIVNLAYLDDLNSFDYPVDIVINYSIYAEDLNYPQNKTYLLGVKYAPLRKQFDISEEILEDSIRKRLKNKQILITTGASDPYHAAGAVVEAILNEKKLSEYCISVIKGRFWDDPRIQEMTNRYPDRIELRENVEDMADLMLRSTIAVSAGGSTLYELCACCIPTVTFSYADNQLGNVNGFAQRGIMEYAGDARNNEYIGDVIGQKLLTYSENDAIISDATDKMRNIPCRNGSQQLAQALILYKKSPHDVER